MLKKLKNEVKMIKWANRKLVFTDMKVILSCSILFMCVIAGIEWLGKLIFNLMV